MWFKRKKKPWDDVEPNALTILEDIYGKDVYRIVRDEGDQLHWEPSAGFSSRNDA